MQCVRLDLEKNDGRMYVSDAKINGRRLRNVVNVKKLRESKSNYEKLLNMN